MDHETLELLAGLSHELRTPLGAIAGYAELLRLGAHGPLPDAQLELLGRIIRNQQSAVEILDAVLAYATASTGALTLHAVDAPLVALLQRATAECASLAAQRDLTLLLPDEATDPAVGTLSIHADGAAAHVVLTALLRAAMVGATIGESIALTVSATEDLVSVEVLHASRGTVAGQAESVFTPFARGHAQSFVSGDMDALALPRARALARASGGDVVAVVEDGQRVLRLSLPRAAATVPAAG